LAKKEAEIFERSYISISYINLQQKLFSNTFTKFQLLPHHKNSDFFEFPPTSDVVALWATQHSTVHKLRHGMVPLEGCSPTPKFGPEYVNGGTSIIVRNYGKSLIGEIFEGAFNLLQCPQA
jgi:hypothetical protein